MVLVGQCVCDVGKAVRLLVSILTRLVRLSCPPGFSFCQVGGCSIKRSLLSIPHDLQPGLLWLSLKCSLWVNLPQWRTYSGGTF